MPKRKEWWLGFTKTAGERQRNAKLATRRWREENREQYLTNSRAYSKKYALENPEKARERNRRYYQKHKTELLEKKKLWQQANKEKLAENSKKHYYSQKLIAISPKCINCESILKFEEITVCNWCTKTYENKEEWSGLRVHPRSIGAR